MAEELISRFDDIEVSPWFHPYTIQASEPTTGRSPATAVELQNDFSTEDYEATMQRKEPHRERARNTSNQHKPTREGEQMPTRADHQSSHVNPYRLQGIPHGHDVQDDSRVDSGFVLPRKPLPPHGSYVHAYHDQRVRRDRCHTPVQSSARRERKDSANSKYEEPKSLARLEGRQRSTFGPETANGWEKVNFGDEIPKEYRTKLIDDKPKRRQSKTGSLVRSLSSRVKKLASYRSSVAAAVPPSISDPLEFKDLDPRYSSHHCAHPDIKSIPIEEAQKRFRVTVHSETPALVESRGGGHVGRGHSAFDYSSSVPSPTARPHKGIGGEKMFSQALRRMKPFRVSRGEQIKRKPLLTPSPLISIPLQPRQVKVIGDPDRMTEFGDFIDYQDEEFDDDDRTILEIKPLSVREAVQGKGKGRQVNRPATTIASYDRAVRDAPPPTVRELVDEIDSQIADSPLSVDKNPVSLRGKHPIRHGPKRRPPRTLPAIGLEPNDDAEAEVMVDTYVYADQTRWVASKRPGEGGLPKILAGMDDASREVWENEEEARVLRERLRRLMRDST